MAANIMSTIFRMSSLQRNYLQEYNVCFFVCSCQQRVSNAKVLRNGILALEEGFTAVFDRLSKACIMSYRLQATRHVML